MVGITKLLFTCCISGYEEFTLDRQVIKNFYSMAEKKESAIDRAQSPLDQIDQQLGTYKPYESNYFDYYWARFAICCKKCSNNTWCDNCKHRKKMHEDGLKRMQEELDIVTFIK